MLSGPGTVGAVGAVGSAGSQRPLPAVFWSMRSLRARAPDEHKRPPRAYVAAIPHFTAFFSFGKTQNLLANLHTVLRFSTCARRKLRCSSDMLQNTAGNGRCEHLLFSQHSGFFSCALKTSIPTKPSKTLYCVHLCTYTIHYSI